MSKFTYTIVDDEGKLTGTVGSTVEMTAKEAAERSGILLTTVKKRIQKGYRKWSTISKDVEQARREGRALFGRENMAHFAGVRGERKERRAQAGRVMAGHKDLD